MSPSGGSWRSCSARRLPPARWLHEPRLAGEQLLHHRLLEVAGLVAAGFESRQLGVHVGKDGGDCSLLCPIFRERNLVGTKLLLADLQKRAASTEGDKASLLRRHQVVKELDVDLRERNDVLEPL